MVYVLKFRTIDTCQKSLDKQIDPVQMASEEAVWSGSSLFAILSILTSILSLITNIFFENKNRKVISQVVLYFFQLQANTADI